MAKGRLSKKNMDKTLENVLAKLKPGDRLEIKRLSTGALEMIPLATERTKSDIINQEFRHLQGQAISLSDASRRYGVKQPTITRWIQAGHIKVLADQGYRIMIDESEAAYCAMIYREKLKSHGGNLRGVTLFDDNGNPYQMKHPDLAERKRQSRHKNKN